MRHDTQLRAAAQAIYEACYPSEEWAPVGFDEAERCRTIHYRQAVGATGTLRADRNRRAIAAVRQRMNLFHIPAA